MTAFPSSSDATAHQHSPGRLLEARRMKAYLLPGLRHRARAWHIRYTSTNAHGTPIEVTGTVLVPRTPHADGPRPLIGYAVGTQGLADFVAAASWQLSRGLEYESLFIAQALRRGWAVAITDYPGLGSDGTHPYVMGRALGPSVLDSMRAARQLADAELDPDGPLAICGYSEGGCAAGWALQLQPSYAPDLPLVGGAVGSPPADLEGMFEAHDGKLFAFLLFWAVMGIDAAYPELEVLSHLKPSARMLAAVLRRAHVVPGFAFGMAYGAVLPTQSARFVHRHPLEVPEVLARVRENRLGSIPPATPILLGAGTGEQIVPFSQTANLYADWRELGVDVTMHTMPRLEHLTGAFGFAPRAFSFLADRFTENRLQRPLSA
ncbi:lipase family protein [Nocardia otitidiscaviarum]|uniref:lipase family protein n=1 Tax=Nocardia otitidiscaviarum TaxID=1823 RepID=UPI0018960187|nr:lipase family protein [Nocardia otitidiscaviarum]MBF6235933.1 lipase [Nocardia otitidiscaviarum]